MRYAVIGFAVNENALKVYDYFARYKIEALMVYDGRDTDLNYGIVYWAYGYRSILNKGIRDEVVNACEADVHSCHVDVLINACYLDIVDNGVDGKFINIYDVNCNLLLRTKDIYVAASEEQCAFLGSKILYAPSYDLISYIDDNGTVHMTKYREEYNEWLNNYPEIDCLVDYELDSSEDVSNYKFSEFVYYNI